MEIDVASVVLTYGYPLIFAIVALESAGVPLPGETVLISAAVYAGMGGPLNIWWVVGLAALGAIVGDNAGFWVGRRLGPAFLVRYGRVFRIEEQHVAATARLFQRHGGKVIFFGRFLAFLRMFAGLLAGATYFPWWSFLKFNALGAVLWAGTLGGAAFQFGDAARQYVSFLSWGGLFLASFGLLGILWASRAAERAARKLLD